MKRTMPPSLSILKNSYHYDRITGHFTHLLNSGGKKRGDRAGYLHKNGYRYLSVGGKGYLEHRVAWYYTHEKWVPELDHRNEIKSQNAMKNLRSSTRSQNVHRNIHKKLSGLPKGVFHMTNGNKLMAVITVNKERKVLGVFHDRKKAAAAYIKAAKKYFGEFAYKDL